MAALIPESPNEDIINALWSDLNQELTSDQFSQFMYVFDQMRFELDAKKGIESIRGYMETLVGLLGHRQDLLRKFLTFVLCPSFTTLAASLRQELEATLSLEGYGYFIATWMDVGPALAENRLGLNESKEAFGNLFDIVCPHEDLIQRLSSEIPWPHLRASETKSSHIKRSNSTQPKVKSPLCKRLNLNESEDKQRRASS